MSLKVVHLVYSFGIGGLERVIVNLINNTTALDVQHSIITLVDDHDFASHLEPDVNLYCLDKQEGKDLMSHWRLFKLLRKIKPDVVHTYNFGTIEYQMVAWLAGASIRVHAEHGKESSYKKIETPRKYEQFRKIMAIFLNYFVVVSKDLQTWGRSRLGLSDDKLKLIFNGISLSEFSSGDREKKSDSYTFVCVGRLVDVKNHTLLIEAFRSALQKEPAMAGAKLIIAGEGPNQNSLQAQVEGLGLGAHVSLVGHCADVPSVLGQSDVFVLSSKYEAMPMTALEAMACRLPVIAPKVGGVEYILENKVNGLLIEANNLSKMAEALVYAFQHQDELRSMGEQGRNLVERKFSVDAMCQRYIDLYQQRS